MDQYDIAVIGGGNAALSAAMTAAEAGAKVVILESAPKS
jgi:tricarballylate dehydrogenase